MFDPAAVVRQIEGLAIGGNRHDSFTPTPRDDALCGDLGVVLVGTTGQIAARYWPDGRSVYFPAVDPDKEGGASDGVRRPTLPRAPSTDSAERRLRKLKEEHILDRRGHPAAGGRTGLWMLTRKAFKREVDDMGLPDEPYPGWPKGRLLHLLDTNDVYFKLAGELDAILEGAAHGPDPAWLWLDERRAHERYTVPWEGGARYHQPDAEIRFLGWVFFLERQTRRAKETKEAIAKKVRDHNSRAEHLGITEQAGIVFACDTPRDIGYVREAARVSRLPVVAGPVEEIVSHLTDKALELS